ncbi:hypothetical protein M885DRAFT_551376 [Pelagophyceae sp. CCMP2097]|nr:hypothetical protein M885DRAFT_551376 [Pelagophyceae sp. CCMP2097]
MPVYVAYIKAELENVGLLGPMVEHTWTIDVKDCMSDEIRKEVTIDPTDLIDLEGSRGIANLVIRFTDSKEKAQCTLLDNEAYKTKFKKSKTALKSIPRALTGDDSDTWVPILAFEARGMDVTKLHLCLGDFVVTSTGGKVFDEVDLSSGDWADYDDEEDLAVSIMSAESKVESVR